VRQETVAATRLADVERMIARRMTKVGRNLAVALAEDDALPIEDQWFRAALIKVESDAVIRVLQNPEGLRSEQIDDYAKSRDKANADGVLRVTAEEWAELGLPATEPKGSGRRAFMVDTTPDAAYAASAACTPGWTR
jgi:hypothetical protein